MIQAIQAQKLKVKMIGLVPGFQSEPFNFGAWKMLSVSKLKEQLGTCTCQDEVVVTKTARASLTHLV